MKDFNLKQYLEFMEDDMLIACCTMQRTAAKITKGIIPHIFNKSLNGQGEANQIIELLRPFLLHCWISQIARMKYEWLIYHLLSPSQLYSGQLMMPDYVLFVEPYSSITFELCFVEVKRKGNHYKGNYESDLVKLGKEVQITINKLVLQRVANQEIVGLLIKEDHVATSFKMDLKYNGQYRMMKISEFNFIRKAPDDILLLPTIMEKLNQIKIILFNRISTSTLKKLYEALRNKDDQEDLTSYIRTPCTSPVHTKISQ
ncbi:hypothetical protein J3Q64DRAFT_1814507 [Phycomyces blakesleeanus]|uniref:NERD domain-containing protein n=1 Tax=Phycomyces blakesleeanus TaxID=4837 RepID=A0ABR3AY04_PHYBL